MVRCKQGRTVLIRERTRWVLVAIHRLGEWVCMIVILCKEWVSRMRVMEGGKGSGVLCAVAHECGSGVIMLALARTGYAPS